MKEHFSCPNRNVKFYASDTDGTQTYLLENHICRFQPQKRTAYCWAHYEIQRMWAEESLNPFLRNRPIVGANDEVPVFTVLASLSRAGSLSTRCGC